VLSKEVYTPYSGVWYHLKETSEAKQKYVITFLSEYIIYVDNLSK
jgi:hypothetical protein